MNELTQVPRELLEAVLDDLWELEAEWRWKKDELRAGNKAQYELVLSHANQLKACLETPDAPAPGVMPAERIELAALDKALAHGVSHST